MSASNSGGGKANRRGKDQAQAAYMKAHPGRFPDSVTRPWLGNGAAERALAQQMRSVEHASGVWERGMIGGVLASRLGLGDYGVSSLFLDDSEAA